MQVLTLEQLAQLGQLKGKRVLIRCDLNAPHNDKGEITNETRLLASVPGIRLALDAGAAVMVVSHLGRPTEGTVTPADSLSTIAARMSELLHCPMPLKSDWIDGVDVAPGEVVMLENCRCNVGEKKCTLSSVTFMLTTPLVQRTVLKRPRSVWRVMLKWLARVR